MTKVYRITPLEKKNVEVLYDIFEEMDDGTIRSWKIEELYRWGIGFRGEDNPVGEWELKSNTILCETDVGYGAELDDLINVNFDFDESFSEEEKEELTNLWYDGGASWLYDGEHNWQVDYDSLNIYGPVQIDLVDDVTGEVFEENIQPKTEGSPMNWQTISDQEVSVWPFPIQQNFGETDKNS